MKKNLTLYLVVVLFSALILSSCASIDRLQPPVNEVSADISVTINGLIVESKPYLWATAIPFTIIDNQGLVVEIENLSDSPIVIDWDKSSISYDGNTSKVILSGQKFITAGSAVPPLTLPKGAKNKVEVYPANNIEYDGGDWKIRKMKVGKDDEITLTISYQHEGEESFVTVSTKPKRAGFAFGI